MVPSQSLIDKSKSIYFLFWLLERKKGMLLLAIAWLKKTVASSGKGTI